MQVTTIQSNTDTITLSKSIVLQCGRVLDNVKVRFTTIGTLNATKSNVVWIFHALTGNSNPLDWWEGIIGPDSAFDAEKDFIVCANMLGSCYGSTGPENRDFPLITIKDMVAVHQELADKLDINQIKVGIGGSMGGQQLLEWAVQEPDRFEYLFPVATNAVHSPWGIAFNEAQRMALDNIDHGKGLEAARAIAMLSYRSYRTFQHSQKDEDQRWDQFSASSYLHHQGEKLRLRFSSDSYYYLSKAMDSHNVGRHGLSMVEVLRKIRSKTLVIGIDTDVLFPVGEQEEIANAVPGAQLEVIQSDYGHDGFLIETKRLNQLITEFLRN